jgi:hypothetical protein
VIAVGSMSDHYIVESVLASKLRKNDLILTQWREGRFYTLIVDKRPRMIFGRTWITDVEWPGGRVGSYVIGNKGCYVLRVLD